MDYVLSDELHEELKGGGAWSDDEKEQEKKWLESRDENEFLSFVVVLSYIIAIYYCVYIFEFGWYLFVILDCGGMIQNLTLETI